MRAAGSSPCVAADSSFNVRCNVADPEQGNWIFTFENGSWISTNFFFYNFSIFRHLSRGLSCWHVDLYNGP